MSKLTNGITGAAVLAGALAVATLPAIAQQTTARPFTPYNGSNGSSLTYNGSNGSNPNAPAPARLYGVPNFPTANALANGNPACDRSSASYNPGQCR
jgi:hypothetical protein